MTDPLRKPLLDWYHWMLEEPKYSLSLALYKTIEEVYGVEITKREVPKE